MTARRLLLHLTMVLFASAFAPGCSGDDGEPGEPGAEAPEDPGGAAGDPTVDSAVPLSGMVAVTLRDGGTTGATDVAAYIRALVDTYARAPELPAGLQFPLAAAATDSVRALDGLHTSVVVKWLDSLSFADPTSTVFGANADYIAYFGDGWDAVEGNAPQFNGSDSAGWVWVNHEYVSNEMPTPTSAPTGQHQTLARWLRFHGLLGNDIFADVWTDADLETYIEHYKKSVGGSWLRIVQDPSTGEWAVDKTAANLRYDATDDTLTRVTGIALTNPDHDDSGALLPDGVAVGIMADCSGAQTPWGTVISAEENVQDYYGDLEAAWTDEQAFVPGGGFDPGAPVTPDVTPSESGDFGANPNVSARHDRDLYGYLVEIDPGAAPGEYEGKTAPGIGHKKLGYMGRARWENATFAVGADRRLIPGQPVVLYSGDDRRGGRIYKWVSDEPFAEGMERADIRGLLDRGKLYVAHFADLDNTTGNTLVGGAVPTQDAPGNGAWIELGLESTAVAPNAEPLGQPGLTVGDALQDPAYNGIGGFTGDDDVRRALFTASAKIGVRELNRPEDLEWNPLAVGGPRLFISFTNHGRKTQLDQAGVLFDPEEHAAASPLRDDPVGAIFALEESADDPNAFTFYQVWRGTEGQGLFDAANPDNLLIDREGGLWFGTDGNFGRNNHADAIYYLDIDPAHQAGADGVVRPSFGLPFRVVAVPSDAEATGPALSSRMGTLFFNVQHPGEASISSWPQR